MRSISELNPKRFVLTAEQHNNMQALYPLLMELQEEFVKDGGKPFVITSGVRTVQDQNRIYADINADRAQSGLKPLRVPLGSQHIVGNAADIQDSAGQPLAKWCLANLSKLESLGMYIEDPSRTSHPGFWVHLQRVPPASGLRVFLP